MHNPDTEQRSHHPSIPHARIGTSSTPTLSRVLACFHVTRCELDSTTFANPHGYAVKHRTNLPIRAGWGTPTPPLSVSRAGPSCRGWSCGRVLFFERRLLCQ